MAGYSNMKKSKICLPLAFSLWSCGGTVQAAHTHAPTCVESNYLLTFDTCAVRWDTSAFPLMPVNLAGTIDSELLSEVITEFNTMLGYEYFTIDITAANTLFSLTTTESFEDQPMRVGETAYEGRSGKLTKISIRIRADVIDRPEALRLILLHELGHAIGLSHIETCNMMKPTIDAKCDTVAVEHLELLEELYGDLFLRGHSDPRN